MLSPSEKAFYLALESLKEKRYSLASDYLDRAAPELSQEKEFVLLRETIRLLVAVRKELQSGSVNSRLDVEEVFTNG